MKRRFLSSIFISFIAIIILSSISFADSDLNISRWLVDANLLKNGSLEISEDISFNFNSPYNVVSRDIVLSKTDGIKDLSISEIVDGEEISYKKVPKAEDGDKNKFKLEEKNQKMNIKIFSPSENENKTFRLKYTIKNVAVKHSDTGELYYKFLGKENETHIDYFSVNLNLSEFEKDNINIFTHGSEEGKIYFSDMLIKSEVRDLSSGEFVENRILFPIEYIFLSKNIGEKSFKEIIEEEESIAEKIEEDLAKEAIKQGFFSKSAIYLSLLGVFLFLFLFFKFKRSPDIFNLMTGSYPDNITAAELSLFIDKAIVPRTFLASLLELASRGYITIEEIKGHVDSKEYSFMRTDLIPEGLKNHQLYLLDWIFNNIKNSPIITTLDFEIYRSKNPTEFYRFQNKWNKLVTSDLKSRNYYDSSARKWGMGLILLSLIWISIGIGSLIFQSMYGIISLVLGLGISFCGLVLFYRTSDKGYIQYRLWNNFKKEIQSKGKKVMDIDEDKTLIYGITLGLPMESLNKFRKNIDAEYYPLVWGHLFFLANPKGGSQFEDRFINSFYGYSDKGNSSSSNFGGDAGGF